MWHTETHREQKEEANLNKNTKTDSSQKKTADRTYKISEQQQNQPKKKKKKENREANKHRKMPKIPIPGIAAQKNKK